MVFLAFNGKITIAELSRIIDVSRPSLYKYVEEFETKKIINIPEKIRILFEFVYSNDCYGKQDIIEYCACNFSSKNTSSLIDEIKILISDDEFKLKLRIFLDSYYNEKQKRG